MFISSSSNTPWNRTNLKSFWRVHFTNTFAWSQHLTTWTQHSGSLDSTAMTLECWATQGPLTGLASNTLMTNLPSALSTPMGAEVAQCCLRTQKIYLKVFFESRLEVLHAFPQSMWKNWYHISSYLEKSQQWRFSDSRCTMHSIWSIFSFKTIKISR